MALHKLKAFHVPANVDAALALLGADETLVLGGGSFLHGLEMRGLLGDVETLVDIRKCGLEGLRDEGATLVLGAAATLAQVAALPDVANAPWLGALADALRHPPAQIRNVATVGGCVAASCPFFDAPTALLALDATVTIRGKTATRHIGLAELFAGMFANSLAPGEIVAWLSLSRPSARTASAFVKLEGNANDLAIVNAAASLSLDASGAVREARIALGGGVGDTTLRSPAAEAVLAGGPPDAARLLKAAEAVKGDISPLADHRASAEYRTAMAVVMVRRALESAVARLA